MKHTYRSESNSEERAYCRVALNSLGRKVFRKTARRLYRLETEKQALGFLLSFNCACPVHLSKGVLLSMLYRYSPHLPPLVALIAMTDAYKLIEEQN